MTGKGIENNTIKVYNTIIIIPVTQAQKFLIALGGGGTKSERHVTG